MEHKIELGDLAIFLEDLDEGIFVYGRGEIADVESVRLSGGRRGG